MSGMLAALLGYVTLQFAIGVWLSRRITTDTDYILAGRSLGTGLVIFSVFATFFGSEAITAAAGAVYDEGLAGSLVDPLAYALAIMLVGLFFAARLRAAELTTFADLFANRYAPGVERLVVLVLLPGSVFWAAAQLRVFGVTLNSHAGMGLATALVVAAVCVGVYSIIGGLLADAVTDTLQGLVVIAGLGALMYVAVQAVGGGAVVSKIDPARMKFIPAGTGVLELVEKLAVPICGTIVAVELISRFLGARTAKTAALGTIFGGILYILVGLAPITLGLIGPTLVPKIENSEELVAKLAEMLLPAPLYVVFVGAIISAVLSTVHATLHAPAAQIAHNVVERMRGPRSPAARLWTVRMAVAGLTVAAYLIAAGSSSIKELVEMASAFGSAGVFVTMMFAMFSRFGGAPSAYAAIGVGMLTWVWSKYVWGFDAPYTAALVLAFMGYIVVGFIDARQPT